MNTNDTQDHAGLSNLSRDSDHVAQYYDIWSPDYDQTLADWNYDAPDQVARLLRAELSPTSVVLDAGCGTGLSGRALDAAGFQTIDGIDLSPRSLEMSAKANVYRTVREVNMQNFPFPIAEGEYDGLVCVGVLTYLTDSRATLREFSRIVKSGGSIVVTQRNDLLIERDFEGVLTALADEGIITQVQVSEPRPYLPNNKEFTDQILVHYVSFKVV